MNLLSILRPRQVHKLCLWVYYTTKNVEGTETSVSQFPIISIGAYGAFICFCIYSWKKKKGAADEQSIIEKISSYLVNPFRRGPVAKTPIEGCCERFKNVFKNNFRGIIGVLVPLCVLTHQVEKDNTHVKLLLMWQWMLWFYLFQPVAIPCTSMIPIFVLPMAGIYSSILTCKCFMTEGIMLYITSSYLLVLLNNSGVDKRIALWFLCCGDTNSQYSGKKLVFKASTAAFFLSIFSSRLIAAFNLTQIITTTFERIEPSPSTSEKSTPSITAMRYVINNAIQTSSSIGGIAILHSSWVTLLFRACFQECQRKGFESPDIFNYLQYSAFAVPVAFAMFIVNLIYHIILMTTAEKKGIPEAQTAEIRNTLFRNQDEIPRGLSLHEVYSVLFTILILAALFTRFNRFMEGWAYSVNFGNNPFIIRCKDPTVTAIFVIILHIIPKSFGFLKLFCIKKRKDLPDMKPESAVLWWRFVDKNVNYGYLFTFGSAIALLRASNFIKLNITLVETLGMNITDLDWSTSLLACIFISAILCNIMTAMAACAIWLPYILLLATVSVIPWPTHFYLAALGIGMACNLGFCSPFQYTPAYYCHHIGRVPIGKMIKYSIPSVLICALILYGCLKSFATTLYDPDLTGFIPIPGDEEYLKILNLMKVKLDLFSPKKIEEGGGGEVPADPGSL